MPKSGLCEIVVLLDRSGSMQSIKADMEGGFNKFMDDQRKEPGECLLTLVQFDSGGIDTVHEAKPIKDVPPLVIEPRGSTPLLDAMGHTIVSVGARLAATPEDARPEKVVFVVVTDGQENASVKYAKEKIAAMVKEQSETWKWHFTFLGANVDAFAEAGAVGIARAVAANYAPKNAAIAMSSLSSNVRGLRSGSSASLTYTASQRAAMLSKPPASAPGTGDGRTT